MKLLRAGTFVVLILLSTPPLTAESSAPAESTQKLRPYRILDTFHAAEEFGEVVFSPDGQSIAFVRTRAATSQATNGLLTDHVRDDVWLQQAPGKPVRNLTQGAADSSGWWSPRWSPDGKRLAFLSSRGGFVTLWIWERATDQVRQLSSEGVDYRFSNDSENGDRYRWLDDRRILFTSMPQGEPVTPMNNGGSTVGFGVEQAEAAWARAKRSEVTASVIDSLQFKLPQRRQLVMEVASGSTQLLGIARAGEMLSATWWLSPSAGAIAFKQPTPASYGMMERLEMGLPASIELRLLDGRTPRWSRALPQNVVTKSLSWSPDGEEVAFFALEDKVPRRDVMYPNLDYMFHSLSEAFDVRWPAVDSKEYPGRLWRVNIRTGEVAQWNTGDLDLGQGTAPLAGNNLEDQKAFLWTDRGELLFKATRLSDRTKVAAKSVPQWLVLSRDGVIRAGKENLRAGYAAEEQRRAKRKVFEKSVKLPSVTASLVEYSSASQSAVYSQSGGARSVLKRHGDFLWRVAAHGMTEELAVANTYRRHIARFEEKIIEYIGLNGENLKAKLTLPYGYQAGRRYPIVADSDIGVEPDWKGFELAGPDEIILSEDGNFAAGGYIYLWGCMPTKTGMDETGRGNLLMLAGGIVPAVEKAVELGFADPMRVFLYGQSSMGYGVAALVTQTSRFKAAVTEVGWVDQISSRLSIDMMKRYSDNPFDSMRFGANYSYVQLPFWRNADQLRRNSPLSYVDRVQTPLMLIGGDFDGPGNGLQQPEMFFSALVQQRKPAQLVRYWGEGHAQRTPANYLDKHQRMFAWYDQWGDIARDADGNILYDDNGNVRSRNGAPPLKPEDFARFDMFAPGGEVGIRDWLARQNITEH